MAGRMYNREVVEVIQLGRIKRKAGSFMSEKLRSVGIQRIRVASYTNQQPLFSQNT